MEKIPFLSSKFPFKNLVFEGGGIKAYVYHGVLPVLEEFGILQQIERVAGASAGAAQAALLCLRLTAEQTIELYKSIDFSQVTSLEASGSSESSSAHLLEPPLSKIRGNLNAVQRLFNHFGLHSNEYMLEWFRETFATYCEGNRRASFSDFRALGFRDLYIPAVNVSRHRLEIFSADTTPDVPVAEAVVMSMSIPFFFEAVRFDGTSFGNGDYYIDGGALSNYPLTIFDHPKYKPDSRHFTYGVNWETLGCRLFTPPESPQRRTPITNIFHFAENVALTVAEMQNVAIEQRTVDQLRSINISNCGVSTVDFEIEPVMSNSKYAEMVATGDRAARQYLENYRLPTDWFSNLKEKLDDFLDFEG